ncbi:MAG TPA: glycosyltransferase [Candidatus Acidoferrum sp.]|nr:glycosyltransferase [Candidatus Acidoferrum sp.]
MRILNVTQSYSPFFEFGGPPVKIGALARGLAARGHEVTVLTVDWGLEKRAAAAEVSSVQGSPFGRISVRDGVTAIYLRTLLRYRAATWNPAVQRFCRERLGDFDVAHIFGLYDFLGPVVAAACVRRNIPYVLEPIGMFVPIVRSLWLKRLYHALYGGRLFEQAAKIIATSEQEAQELARGGVKHDKLVLRRNGVERPAAWPEGGIFRKKLEIAKDDKVVLFLGRLSLKKSPDLLLRAFASLKNDSSLGSLKLVFAGPDEGGMQGGLEKLATELGVAPQVRFAGGVFGQEKWAAYRDADVFVLPSQNENFGNTAAEAIAAGTPVVVTEQCGIAPLLADVVGLVAAHEAGELAEAIRRVFRDSLLREKLVAGCEQVASLLGWELPVLEMEMLYSGLATRKARSAESSP